MAQAAEKSSSKQPHHESERYKHDMEQAIAMRRRKPNAPLHQNQSSSRSIGSQHSYQEKDVAGLGLRGLDEADNLREQGHLSSALKLYESAIEVLIRYLRDHTAATSTYDLGALEARIRVALSDAEVLKKQLKGKQQSSSESSQESQQLSPMKKTCFSRITQYLASLQVSSDGPPSAAVRIRPVASSISVTPQARNSTRKIVSQPQKTTSPQSQSSAAATSPRQPLTLKSSEAKEMVEAVLDDMYIHPSKLGSTTWDDIAGLKTAKQALQESAILPLVRPDLFTGLRKPQNIMLYGPPGTGKTMLVRAVAHESKSNLFLCSASAMTSKWHGEGEKLVRTLFQLAREYGNSIIFVDEVDSLLSTRKSDGEHEASRRFKTEFMVQLDGISDNNNKQVLLLAATNCPWDVDTAVMRRFSRRIYVPLPDISARKALLKHLLDKAGKYSLTKDQISTLVKRLKGFSGSDIASISSEASFGPLRSVGSLDAIRQVRAKDVRPISMEDFEASIAQATKSVTKDLLKRYEEWQQQQT